MKSFAQAKARLASSLGDAERVALVKSLAAHVIAAARSGPTFVVCDDGAVADWSIGQRATAVYAPGLGLNGAVTAGVALLARLGFDLAVVAHADLPFVAGLDRFGTEGEISIAPDRRDDGTNVIAVPTAAPFRFSYGPGSFDRHRQEAARVALPCAVVRDERFSTDVDVPDDLRVLEHLSAER
jgi:2-phospho-L-lactate/phosphoenolpyruvate guanylyltransferase